MKKKELQELPRWFKSNPVTQKFTDKQIDRENGILKGVIMCSVGPAKGHGVNLEQEFINDLIEYDRRHHAKSGIKARFGHPAMSDTTMGKQLGVFRNFSIVGQNAVADLHLLDASNLSPTNPKMKDWVLSMAEENPDFIMSSIVFVPGGYYQYDDNGAKKPIWYYKEYQDDEGKSRVRWVAEEDGKEVFVAFGEKGEHHYTDLVEQGAATDSLFAAQFNRDKFAVQAIEFVQEHPALLKFLQENPTKLTEFATKLGIELPKSKLSIPESAKKLKDYIFGASEEEAIDPAIAIREELEEEYAEKLLAIKAELSELKEEKTEVLTRWGKERDEDADTIRTLQARIKELSERVPDDHTQYDEKPNEEKEKPKQLDAVTQRAVKNYNRRNKK